MRLSEVLKRWRRMSDLTVRDAAKQMGIGFATLSRIENGGLMDGATLGKVITWLLGAK